MRILVLIGVDIQTGLSDPVTSRLVSFAASHALALQTESHVVEHRAVVEAGVILKHHAAIGARFAHFFAEHQHFADGRRMLRFQAGDKPQNRAFAATAGTEDAHELAFARQIGNDETHITNGSELIRLPFVVGLRDIFELHDVRHIQPRRIANAGDHAS